jgi:hypothetical protein
MAFKKWAIGDRVKTVILDIFLVGEIKDINESQALLGILWDNNSGIDKLDWCTSYDIYREN